MKTPLPPLLLVASMILAGLGPAMAGAPTELTTVSITATRRIAEETAAPLRRLNLVGEFTVSRTGSTEFSQPVWLHVSGSATPATDYKALPLLITIPAGEPSVSFPVTAFNDDLPEGIETVVAQVSNCPPGNILAPCYAFLVDPHHERDTVFIREDGLTVATTHITRPDSGTTFPAGAPIQIEAIAIHLNDYIHEVEFFDGPTRIGTSTLYFFIAPTPGTPIQHIFEWKGAAPGPHVLTARARLLDGTLVVSSPVRITVGSDNHDLPPLVAITSPTAGASFPAGAEVPIVVETRDPDGWVPRVEFFADGMKIGEANVAYFTTPVPNQPQTFTFTWQDPMPGGHVLTARAHGDGGASALSAPVYIQIAHLDPKPTVMIVARDAFAVEPDPTAPPNTATFRISRSDPLHEPLTVHYSISGRATNGVDYATLSGLAEIAPGSRSVDVVVDPLADTLKEHFESVILTLDEHPTYRPGHRRRAIALIADRPWHHPPFPRCRNAGDGLVHLCFPAGTGETCRLEGSNDLHTWRTLCDLVAIDGTLHVVEETDSQDPVKFLRVTP